MAMTAAVERVRKVVYKAEWTAMSMLQKNRNCNGERIYHEQTERSPESFDTVYRHRGGAFIEPKYGYLISDQGCLAERSMVPNYNYPGPPWRISMPNPLDFAMVRRKKERVKHYSTVISLRHFWEWNYFHFYNDVLGRLRLFDNVLRDKSIPLLLGNYADDVPFVKQIIKIGGLSDRNWILPGHEFVHADEVYYCRTQQTWKNKFAYTVSQMNLPSSNNSGNERIYLIRPPTATRRVINQAEIDPILQKYGFRTVETSCMTIADQIALFARTRYLVAMHGAGILNIIFRDGAPLALLELRPDVYWSEDFQEICQEYGYQSSTLTGPAEAAHGQHASFSIDPEQLDVKIGEMLCS